MEPDKNLVDQCVKGEGLVQINVQVRTASKRINIVDVLKPTDDVLGSNSVIEPIDNPILFCPLFLAEVSETASVKQVAAENKESSPPSTVENMETSGDEATSDSHANTPTTAQSSNDSNAADKSESVKWVIDNNFRKELVRLGFSDDPAEWLVLNFNFFFSIRVKISIFVLQDRCASTTLVTMGREAV